jgi:hypothetical protein
VTWNTAESYQMPDEVLTPSTKEVQLVKRQLGGCNWRQMSEIGRVSSAVWAKPRARDWGVGGLKKRAGPQGVAVFQRAFTQAAAKNDQDRQMTVTETMWSTTPGQRGRQEGVWAAQPPLQRARHRNMPCAPPRPRADELAWPRSESKGNEKRATGRAQPIGAPPNTARHRARTLTLAPARWPSMDEG